MLRPISHQDAGLPDAFACRGDKCRISIQAERDRFVIEREEVIEQAKGDK